MKKKILLIACAVALIASLAVAGTTSYYASKSNFQSTVSMHNMSVDLIEKDKNGKEIDTEEIAYQYGDDENGFLPGSVRDLVVTCVNTGSEPVYVRVRADKYVAPIDGVTIESSELLKAVENLNQMVSFREDPGNWTYYDGYYYYNWTLEPGKETYPVFTEVLFSNQMDNEYRGTAVTIDVSMEAVQSRNNGTGPLYAIGWE